MTNAGQWERPQGRMAAAHGPATTGQGRQGPKPPSRGPAVVAWTMAVLLAISGSPALAGSGVGSEVGDVVGTLPFGVVFTQPEDTLPDLAVANDVGYRELALANPTVDPWLPPPGTLVVVPTAHVLPNGARQGILINLADQRLYVFPQAGPTMSFPIGIGTEGADVRVGKTYVKGKRVGPTWVPTANLRRENPDLPLSVPPGEDNPLGPLALDLGWESIVIHGTNKPYGVGRRVSHGCFRLFNTDITTLFKMVAVGTPVQVVDQPVKLGWNDGDLYLEIHPTIAQAEELEATGRYTPLDDALPIKQSVAAAAGTRAVDIDWNQVEKAIGERSGMPIRVLQGRLQPEDAPHS